MHHSVIAAALVAVLVAGSCDPTQAVAPGPTDPVVARFIDLANAARREAGCGELDWKDPVAEVALRHSADMRTRVYFSHTNPEGQSPFDRLDAAGIRYRAAAENILQGAVTAEGALDLWMNSPGHRANLLECAYTGHGVGRADTYWTHVFVREPG